MDSWLDMVLRQIILYSLPLMVSLSVVGMIESRLLRSPMPHAFFSLSWRGAWLPFLACIAMHRGVVFALPRGSARGARAAAYRFAGHGVLCALGLLLYTWSLSHPAAMGLPPLHHWWAKVLMFFNLCMLGMHLLPLPGMLLGEWLLPRLSGTRMHVLSRLYRLDEARLVWLWVVLAASPLPDAITGAYVIFPVYAEMATWAAGMAH